MRGIEIVVKVTTALRANKFTVRLASTALLATPPRHATAAVTSTVSKDNSG